MILVGGTALVQLIVFKDLLSPETQTLLDFNLLLV